MQKLSLFLYCNFFKLEFLLRTFVASTRWGGGFLASIGRIIPPGFFGQFWPDNPAWDAVTVIFMGGGINNPPLLLPWAVSYSLSLSSIVDLE
jgi:hypothetical protein